MLANTLRPISTVPKRVLIAVASVLAPVTFFWFIFRLAPPAFGKDDFHNVDLDISPIPIKKLPTWELRQDEVRRAFVHAYSGYMKYAFPADELLSTSGGNSNKFNGWSVTMLDSMDTMWIMRLESEFAHAVQVVAAQNFTTDGNYFVPFFETVIRYLGGILSAYSLSGEPILLSRADDLGTLLLPVFDVYPSGFPAYSVNVQNGLTKPGWMGSSILFSEATSCQLEFKYLAKLTGRKEYYVAVDHIMDRFYDINPEDGLFAVSWSGLGIARDRQYSVGASADSGYEYFLKQYILSGDIKALTQYLKSIDGIMKWLLFVTPTRELLYVASMNHRAVKHELEHLACFLPGLLALGAHIIPEAYMSPKERERHRWAAEGLAYTCYVSYADQKSGLGPDGLKMTPGTRWVEKVAAWEAAGRVGVPPGLKEEGPRGDRNERDYDNGSPVYLLRPETVESLYVLWKTTGDQKWRERGYDIFVAIERHAKTQYGYASVEDVDKESVRPIDDMPSFFLAETLKYLFLLFDEGDPYPFSKWVFNTEAHPLPVFEWSSWEQKQYGLASKMSYSPPPPPS